MPNIKSAKKSVLTDAKTAAKNKIYTSRIKNSIKKTEMAVKNKDKDTAIKELKIAVQNIDKAASKGIIKQNTCNRQKTRLNKIVKEM